MEAELQKLKTILDAQPNNLQAHQNLVSYYLDISEHEQAIKCLLDINHRWPDNTDAYRILGTTYLNQSNWDKAGKVFLHLSHVYPERVQPLIQLAHIFNQLNNNKEAINYCKKALTINPNSEKALDIMGHSLLMTNETQQAKSIFERLVKLNPASTHNKYFLSALNGKNQPEQSPTEYVKNIFDGVANNFETMLVDKLKYKVPELLKKEIKSHIALSKLPLKILDIGCGTGLMAKQLKDISAHLIGIDISEKMLEQAKNKNLYDELINIDILKYFQSTDNKFDLIVAADVFIYIGNLSALFYEISKSLQLGSLFCFSTEKLDSNDDFKLHKSCRYAHSKKYINSIAEKNSLKLKACIDIVCRIEKHTPVAGNIFILSKL